MELTVGDALLLLSKYPKDMRVVVHGYEDGYDNPIVFFKNLMKRKLKPDWEGQYIEYKNAASAEGEPFQALVFGRPRSEG